MAAAAVVLGGYAEPHRRYHTIEHLNDVLRAFDELHDLAGDPVSVELALWFHDVIYDPRANSGENERASALVARELLTALDAPEATVASTVRLVELTARHVVEPGDTDGAVLADADLSVLGATEDRYRRYAADVRDEYAWVDDEAWRAGRSALVQSFLGRSRIFATDRQHARLDGVARRNLGWELAQLTTLDG